MRVATKLLELVLLTRQLADLAHGGLPLTRSLEIIRRQTRHPEIKNILSALRRDVENGRSFSQALAAREGFFGPVFIGLVKSGESTGQLDRVLDQLALMLENDLERRQRIQTALAYPLILIGLSIGVCCFLTFFVVPRFSFLFLELGQQLPWPTQALIAASKLFVSYGWLVILPLIVTMLWLRPSRAKLKTRLLMWIMNVPLLSEALRGISLERWSHSMAALLRNGFTVMEALMLSQHAMDNTLFAAPLQRVKMHVQDGMSLSRALRTSPLFPQLIYELVGAGEEAASLEESLERIAHTYKRESELRWKLFLSLLEPTLIVMMGLLVGFVAIAMLLPIFQMSATLR